MKNVWHLVKHNAHLNQYLPTNEMNEGRFPDKEFFWGIAFTVLPTWANLYTSKVLANRHQEKPEDPNETKTIKVSNKWLEKLR